MKRVVYFYEGETEKTLLQCLKGKNIKHGKLKKFNLWNNKIKKSLRQLAQSCFLLLILIKSKIVIFLKVI